MEAPASFSYAGFGGLNRWQIFRRIFGFASRASVLTLQRVLDIYTVFAHLRSNKWSMEWMILVASVIITTVLMTVTMKGHWSALWHNKPHGIVIGALTSVLQIAPLWETLDKMLFHEFRHTWKRQSSEVQAAEVAPVSDMEQPLLKLPSRDRDVEASKVAAAAAPPKGSPGENMMRGLRKMTILNLPQAFASLWCHTYQVMPVFPPTEHHSVSMDPFLRFACSAALICFVFGVADFVLFIWVDDAFVRSNKKLVTLHYLVEILSRVPIVVLFHVTYSRRHGYWPTLHLLAGDMLVTSLLLLLVRLYQPRRCFCWCVEAIFSYQTLRQFLYSLFVSAPLFFVNIVFFDPGMSFFFVNQVFYVVKYVELWLMWSAVQFVYKYDGYFGLPQHFYLMSWKANVVLAAINAIMVFIVVPRMRGSKVDHLVNEFLTTTSVSGSRLSRVVSDFRNHAKRDSTSRSPRRAEPSPPSREGKISPEAHSLERLEEIFEMLWLLSQASQRRNCVRVLEVTVNDLWLQALSWEGIYDDGAGGMATISPGPTRNSLIVQRWNAAGALTVGGASGSVLANTLVLPDAAVSSGMIRGSYDGRGIYWDDGDIWTRREASRSAQETAGHDALQLILPQLALALCWDDRPPPTRGHRQCASPIAGLDDESGGPAARKLLGGRPLLDFLIRYSFISQRFQFLSDLYWSLVCLSHDEDSVARSLRERPYSDARQILLESMQEDVCTDWPAAMRENLQPFLRSSRQLLQNQREIWRQKICLVTNHSGRASGGGSWTLRTQALRLALQNWTQHRRQADAIMPDIDDMLLQDRRDSRCSSGLDRRVSTSGSGTKAAEASGQNAGGNAALPDVNVDQNDCMVRGPSICLVRPATDADAGPVSLPIDPATHFRGVVIEESEVIASKQAPLMLTCRTRQVKTGSLGLPDDVDEQESGEEETEKYLVKIGDDLRQDQLMLQLMQLMECAWQAHLRPEDADALRLATFKVLAITPSSGYVKCIPDAIPLSTALHQARGHLEDWLDKQRPPSISLEEVLDNFCGSVAASCVVTYVLGIGDRHMENICITPRGFFFHIDFSFVLGDDPKPIAPPVRLPQAVAQALLRTRRLSRCFELAGRGYVAVRPFAGLLGSLLRLTAEGGGFGCVKLSNAASAKASIAGVHERLRVDNVDDEAATSEFLCLLRESFEGLSSIFLDKVHAAGLFWR
eukprot:TRINITY_DN101177_c0_g1_i1.p1 TRINITY_DN101177_c0_g1~~TRINITY_DN101177_c0_g1_i1.p1  ORF type:complete len:1198 (-),score=207.77 TRINITY_DN101177_c0_g1_i1:33-3626(-)